MLKVDLRRLLRRINRFWSMSLNGATGLGVARRRNEACTEHLLAKLVAEPSADVQLVSRRLGVDLLRPETSLQRALESSRSRNTWINESWFITSVELGLTEVRSGVLLASLFGHSELSAARDEFNALKDINADELEKRFYPVAVQSSEDATASTTGAEEGSTRPQADDALSRFSVGGPPPDALRIEFGNDSSSQFDLRPQPA